MVSPDALVLFNMVHLGVNRSGSAIRIQKVIDRERPKIETLRGNVSPNRKTSRMTIEESEPLPGPERGPQRLRWPCARAHGQAPSRRFDRAPSSRNPTFPGHTRLDAAWEN